MKKIELTKGYYALVDDEDYDAVSQFKWHAFVHGNTAYAVRNVQSEDGRWTTQKLHRFLMNPPDDMYVDHADRNGLNNQRSNLRLATHAQNVSNGGPRRNNTSGYRGVYLHRKTGKWRAEIRVSGRKKSLGYYTCPVEAAKARDKAALEMHGEFAALNFP